MSYKWIYLIISLLLCCSMLLSCRENGTVDTQELETVCYYDSDEDGSGYTYDKNTQTLTIRGNGEMNKDLLYSYGKIDCIKKVVINDGLTNIADFSFAFTYNDVFEDDTGFKYLESVEIPKSVSSIGAKAFNSCENLSNIDIPNTVLVIGDSAFAGSGLIKISFPDKLEIIEVNTCWSCKELKKVEIGDNVHTIEASAFSNCYNLSKIELSKNLRIIGNHAFVYCENLIEITLPKSVQEIGKEAFFGCENLKEVTIKSKTVKLGKYSFGYKEVNNKIVPIEGFTIKGYKGSTAEKYAQENGFKFVSLD